MSKIISDILEAPEPHFSHRLREWEKVSGNPSHDARLASDVAQRRREMLRVFELDLEDTTPKEFYFALKHRARNDNQYLLNHIKIKDTDSPKDLVSAIVKFVESLDTPREIWVIKQSALKLLLKKNPPKKLMKVLGIRSIDSMLKRSNVNELLALAYELENTQWTDKFRESLKKLKPGDFQATKSSIDVVSQEREKKLRGSGFHATRIVKPVYETGSILVVPPAGRYNGDGLSIALSLIQALIDTRVYSAYFRFISVNPSFGENFYRSISQGLPGVSVYKTLGIGWPALQRHVVRSNDALARLEQPHLQIDDIHNRGPIEILASALPEFGFWAHNDYVFYHEKNAKPVSSHLIDVITNISNNADYEHATRGFMQMRLWEELCLRYLSHENIENHALEDLEKL